MLLLMSVAKLKLNLVRSVKRMNNILNDFSFYIFVSLLSHIRLLFSNEIEIGGSLVNTLPACDWLKKKACWLGSIFVFLVQPSQSIYTA